MERFQIWILIAVAVGIALIGNSISAIWASKEDKFSLWLLALVVISPFVFIIFGLLTTKLGVTVSAATIDALLTVSTVIVGLVLFQEWHKLNTFQYSGLVLVFLGIILLQFSEKTVT